MKQGNSRPDDDNGIVYDTKIYGFVFVLLAIVKTSDNDDLNSTWLVYGWPSTNGKMHIMNT